MPNFYINFLNKTVKSLSILCDFAVASFMGAWIKIKDVFYIVDADGVASFMGAWIKIHYRVFQVFVIPVASFMGAWIKIHMRGKISRNVALFTGAWIKIKYIDNGKHFS